MSGKRNWSDLRGKKEFKNNYCHPFSLMHGVYTYTIPCNHLVENLDTKLNYHCRYIH